MSDTWNINVDDEAYEVSVQRDPDGWYTALIEELGVTISADSLDELDELLPDAVRDYLNNR